MSLTPEQQKLLKEMSELPMTSMPRNVTVVARQFGMSTAKLRNFLALLIKKGLVTLRLDKRVLIQKELDKKYINVTEMVSAPLLTANEIREKRLYPGWEPRRFSAVSLPREIAGNKWRYCSYVVPDNALGPLHMWENQIAVCAIGMLPRPGAPVLCILPGSEYVCIRCCVRLTDDVVELYDPERLDVRRIQTWEYGERVIGTIVSTVRFWNTGCKPEDWTWTREKEK